ncbi:thap-type zinc finger superfamily [Holotrichia oblita]|uniref:Thap-type zinc finger superfamily n=1 Tax=Holotrichia oblita TaxID=644536 RepID=A0ACB9T8R5_HOLOL|nr:thap-type zinc finger superfamily [Holotrichia oblita]
MGAKSVLTLEEEKKLETWILNMAKLGFPVHTDDVLNVVSKVIKETNRQTPFVENRPGKKWVNLFLKRHPDVKKRNTEIISKSRAAVSEEGIRNWFVELKKYIDKEKLNGVIEDATRIFNCDEIGMNFCPKTGKLLGPRNYKNFYEIASGPENENITMLCNYSAVVFYNMGKANCAVFGCKPENTDSQHLFPNPITHPDLFKKWLSATNNGFLINLSHEHIYTHYRICGKHFDKNDRGYKNILKRIAYPKHYLSYAIQHGDSQPKSSSNEEDIEQEDPQPGTSNSAATADIPELNVQHVLMEHSYHDSSVCQASAAASSSHQLPRRLAVSPLSYKKDQHIWSNPETLLLIKIYREKEADFSSGKMTVKQCWDNVSKELTKQGYKINGYKCGSKFQTLKRTYKSIKDHNGQSGNNRKKWEYFEVELLFI